MLQIGNVVVACGNQVGHEFRGFKRRGYMLSMGNQQVTSLGALTWGALVACGEQSSFFVHSVLD